MISHFRMLPTKRRLLIALIVLVPLCALGAAAAAGVPVYSVMKVLVAEDQYQGERDLVPTAVYKPHEVAVSQNPHLWISSNERGGFAGITIYGEKQNVLAHLNIEEPGLDFTEPAEEEEEEIGNEKGPEEPEPNFPAEIRLDPEVCLPVVLPPGATAPSVTEGTGKNARTFTVKVLDAARICAPLGAEGHARHPHGIDVDKVRKLAYQVIEHSGLKWNARRTAFEVALTADEESGMLLVYDIADPRKPTVSTGYLLGHGAHEVAVNENNGKVFQGNHEDSPGVTPNIWVDVIDPSQANPYGFIDTGWSNAVQGIEVDESLNLVFGTTHVGEKMFAFDGNCLPILNVAQTAEKQMGENCIEYQVDLRTPFMEQVGGAEGIFEALDSAPGVGSALLPAVLHMHDLAVDPVNHRVYQTLHGIHHAEHTGSPEEAELRAPNGKGQQEEEGLTDVMGRWVAEVDVDPRSRTFGQVTYIDLSNGFSALDYPTAGDVPEAQLLDSFVHAHWVAVDPIRNAVVVSGEHTGNIAVVNRQTRGIAQMIRISRWIPGCVPPVDEEGNPEPPEPHVHGGQINQQTGALFIADEGSSCYYESITRIQP